jgi:hypothetical protein
MGLPSAVKPFRKRDTVVTDTPAAFATSLRPATDMDFPVWVNRFTKPLYKSTTSEAYVSIVIKILDGA